MVLTEVCVGSSLYGVRPVVMEDGAMSGLAKERDRTRRLIRAVCEMADVEVTSDELALRGGHSVGPHGAGVVGCLDTVILAAVGTARRCANL